MNGEDQLPPPPVPFDCDCTDLDGFMLNVERLMASELVALGSHEEVAAALFLWCRAWKQVPAASLPDDERVLAAFSRLPLPRFRKLRGTVMRGFVKCSDGRLYHRFLAKEAMQAFERKSAFRKKRETDAERLRKWRSSQSETPTETHDETRFVAEGQGQGQGQLREERKAAAASGELFGQAVPPDRDPYRGNLETLEGQLRQAAGWQTEAAPKLFVVGSVQSLLDKGFDLNLDILDVVRAVAPRLKRVPGGGWEYFIPAMVEARDKRLQAGAAGAKPVVSSALTPEQGWRNKVAAFKRSGLWMPDWDGRPGDPIVAFRPQSSPSSATARPKRRRFRSTNVSNRSRDVSTQRRSCPPVVRLRSRPRRDPEGTAARRQAVATRI